jgi:hypothetical protein
MDAMASAPSTEWKEQVGPDEDAQLTRLAEQLREVQRRATRKAGQAGRALHRKPHLGVEASFEVLGGLPAEAAQGMFAQPGRYHAYVRFSNGSSGHFSDRRGDVRGVAIKLVGVDGVKVIPGLEAARTQDFLLVLAPAIPFATPDEFVRFVVAASRPATALPRLLFGVGPRRLLAVLGALRRSMSQPVPSLATVPFHSALPMRWGAYAAKVRLVPRAAPAAPDGAGPDYLAEDLARRLAAGPLVWDFAVQLYRDPTTTPIEDPTVVWPDDVAPPIPVGKLTIERGELTAERARKVAAFVEALSFDPWHARVEHRPLGALMRARNHAYRLSTAERKAAAEPDGSEAF